MFSGLICAMSIWSVFIELSSFQSHHILDMEWGLPHLIVVSKMKHSLQSNSACLFL